MNQSPTTEVPVLPKPPGYNKSDSPIPTSKSSDVPAAFRHKSKRKRSCCCVSCCFCWSLIIILLSLLAIACGIFYLLFKPRLPTFHIRSLNAPRFLVTAKSDGTFVDSETITVLKATNPNEKIELSYATSRARLTADANVLLGSTSFPAFYQEKKNTTLMKFPMVVKNMLIDDAIGSELKSQFRSKELAFYVEVSTKVGAKVGSWTIGKIKVSILCKDVSLKQLEGGVKPKCTISVFKWINL